MRRGPPRPLPPHAVSGSFWAGILTPAPELVVSASKPVASPLLSLPLPSSSHTERNALSSPLCASRSTVLSQGCFSSLTYSFFQVRLRHRLLLEAFPGLTSTGIFCVSIAFDTYLCVPHSSHFLQPFTLSLPPECQLHKDSAPGHSSTRPQHSA